VELGDLEGKVLVRELVKRQTAEGLTDIHFAEKLGISDSYWTLIRSGHRRLTVFVLGGALRAYPDLREMTLAHLIERNQRQPVAGGEPCQD
jgi:transcriptional regulator with XRE-family HTH domain